MPDTPRPETRSLLENLLSERILLLDGAMGTMIHAHKPTEEDYRGERFKNHSKLLKNNTEIMVLTQPRMIEDIHRAYLEAGSDIIETDSFNSNPISLQEYDLAEYVHELNVEAARIARRAADDYTARTPEKPRFVAGSIGPTNKMLNNASDPNNPDPSYRPVSFDQLVAAYSAQVHGLVSGGVDILLAETAFDTLNLKACLFAIEQYFDRHSRAPARDGLDHDLRRRTHPDCADDRSVLGVDVVLRPAERRHQLRARRRPDASLCRKPLRGRPGVSELLPERRPAQRGRRVRR